MAGAFDFTRAVTELLASSVDPNQLSVWGGEFQASGSRSLEQLLEQFLTAWNLSQMPYRILEYTDRMTFTLNHLPDSQESGLFERARVFGAGGDLSVRRDSDRFLWHFVGMSGTQVPGGFGAREFWRERPDTRLRCRDESALLWGEHRGENDQGQSYWHDDRVGWAKLTYPYKPAKRVKIHYTVFTEGGQVAFLWWKELQEHG